MVRARCIWPVLLIGAGPAHAAPHTVEELVRPSLIRDLALSPDGKRIAIAQSLEGKEHDVVAIIDAERLGEPGAVRAIPLGDDSQFSVDWVGWATDTRLLMGLTVKTHTEMRKAGTPEGFYAALFRSRRVIATEADGSRPAILFSGSRRILRHSVDLARIVDYTPEDPTHVIMPAWSGNTYDLFRVNVYSGAAERIARGGVNTYHWETEDGRPALRYDSNRRGTVISVFGRANEDAKDWSLLVRYREKEDRKAMAEWAFAGDAPGAGRIYVRTRRDGSDTAGIHPYDIATKTLGEPVAHMAGVDMQSAVTVHGQYAGAAYVGDRLTYALTDDRLQKHLDGLDRYFKGDANVIVVDCDLARTKLLIHAHGPRAPGEYYLYDVAQARLSPLVSARPWLSFERLAGVEIRRVRTRDGATITSYLTRLDPNAEDSRPLIVLPHGGPELRDAVDFDPIAQAFAAQGWLVLQPNFRGSGGYGRAFAEAGHRQWARRVQDDITDAVHDLVETGLADPTRIAIYGASYGGYAALAGAVVTPDLYRAAVSLAGISDPGAFVNWVRKEDGADSDSYSIWVKRIGDPKADKAEIDAASPRMRAGEIRIPILLMHGTYDHIVPVEQSTMMKTALEKAGKSVKYVPFEGEGHSSWSTHNEQKQLKEAISFLAPLFAR